MRWIALPSASRAAIRSRSSSNPSFTAHVLVPSGYTAIVIWINQIHALGSSKFEDSSLSDDGPTETALDGAGVSFRLPD